MTKETWISHMKETTGLVPPSQGGDRTAWQGAIKAHSALNCAECKARGKTKSKSLARAMRDQAMRDCGLVKVRGASGGVYWE